MTGIVIAVDDPRRADVTALLTAHLEFARSCTPAEFVFALDIDALVQPAVTVCTARRDGALLAVGALKELDPTLGELKSMHTTTAARRLGVGAAMVDHLVGLARRRGYRRVSLETGSQDAFAPARATRCSPNPPSTDCSPPHTNSSSTESPTANDRSRPSPTTLTTHPPLGDHHDADADTPEVVPSHWRWGGPIRLAGDSTSRCRRDRKCVDPLGESVGHGGDHQLVGVGERGEAFGDESSVADDAVGWHRGGGGEVRAPCRIQR